MPSQDLLNYIKNALAQGQTRQQITITLLNQGGWNQNDLDAAFAALSSPTVAVPSTREPVQIRFNNPNNISTVAGDTRSYHWAIGLLLFLISLVGTYLICYFTFRNQTITLGVAGVISSVVIVNLLIVWLLTSIFHVPNNTFSKALLYAGANGVFGLFIQASSLLNLSDSVQMVLFIITVIVSLIILTRIYAISISKGIAIIFTSGVLTMVAVGIILTAFLFAGLFSFKDFLDSSLKNNSSVTDLNTTTPTLPDSEIPHSASTTNSAISFMFTSPKGNENWQQGKTYTVTWVSSGITDKGMLLLIEPSGGSALIATYIDISSDSYSWRINSPKDRPSCTNCGTSAPLGNGYRLQFETASSAPVYTSNAFNITPEATPTTPTTSSSPSKFSKPLVLTNTDSATADKIRSQQSYPQFDGIAQKYQITISPRMIVGDRTSYSCGISLSSKSCTSKETIKLISDEIGRIQQIPTSYSSLTLACQ